MKDQCKPNFFVIGAPKCGTTTLYENLTQHPEVYMPKVKEPNFFADKNLFAKGLNWYKKKYFNGAENFNARGEATPRYLRMYDIVIPNLKQSYDHSESPRFIIILRDPVKRAWSHYLHQVRNGLEDRSFKEALELEEERLLNNSDLWFGYFRDGLYSEQIEPWFSAYPRDKFLILFTHELANSPLSVMKEVYRFLEIDDTFEARFNKKKSNPASKPRSKFLSHLLTEQGVLKRVLRRILLEDWRRALYLMLIRHNTKPYEIPPEMPQDIAKLLQERYKLELDRLECLLKRDISRWKV